MFSHPLRLEPFSAMFPGGLMISGFEFYLFRAFALLSAAIFLFLFYCSSLKGLDELAESLISVLAIALASGLFCFSLELRLRALWELSFGPFWSWALGFLMMIFPLGLIALPQFLTNPYIPATCTIFSVNGSSSIVYMTSELEQTPRMN